MVKVVAIGPATTEPVASPRVVRFLSDEWLRELDRVAREAWGPLAWNGRPLVLEQVVLGSPRGDVRFHLVVGADGLHVAGGPAERADAVFTADLETATALADGSLNVQTALAAGRYRLRGDLELLARHGDALIALGDLFRAVRVATVFPDPG